MPTEERFHVCTADDMHPYNCVESECVHCNRAFYEDDLTHEDHDPNTCPLCDDTEVLDRAYDGEVKAVIEERMKATAKAHRYEDMATEIGKLVDRKQKAYGDSFGRSSGFLKGLYPDGISPNQYDDFLFAARIFDKLCRIACDKDALGESPFIDIVGYALLGCFIDQERKEHGKNIPTEDEFLS